MSAATAISCGSSCGDSADLTVSKSVSLSSSTLSSSSGSSSGSSCSNSNSIGGGRHVVIVPGNGCSPIFDANWYSWLAQKLEHEGFVVSMQDMPDPDVARESIWIPFIQNQLKCTQDSIIIGHSSGAQAAMRLLESHRVHAAVLVSACHTDMGIENETASGYYNRPWDWESIRKNANWILQFSSIDDRHVPIIEQRYVAEHLKSEYIEFKHEGHFLKAKVEKLWKVLIKRIEKERDDNVPKSASEPQSSTAGNKKKSKGKLIATATHNKTVTTPEIADAAGLVSHTTTKDPVQP